MSELTATAAINPYKAPDAPLAETEERVVEGLFYVVSPTKFLVLMIGSLGMYPVYWFYKNWSLLDRKHKQYWPVMRGLFSIFFAHALFHEVDDVLKRESKLRAFSWSPGALATGYVLSALAGNVLGRLSGKDIGSPITDVLALLMLVPETYVLYRAQLAINVAEGDPSGLRNSRFTAANIIWLVLFGLFWLAVIAGLFLIFSGTSPD